MFGKSAREQLPTTEAGASSEPAAPAPAPAGSSTSAMLSNSWNYASTVTVDTAKYVWSYMPSIPSPLSKKSSNETELPLYNKPAAGNANDP
jgi:hypothetical protein